MPRAIRLRIDKEPLPWAGRLHRLVGRHAPALAPLITRLVLRLPRRLRIRIYAEVAYTNLRLFTEGEGRAGMAIYHPDVQFFSAPHWAQFGLPERVAGREAVLRYVEQWSAIYDEVDYRQVEVIDLGNDTFLGRWTLTGTVRGLSTSIDSGQLGRLARDGRIIEQHEYSWPEAVAAAGLPPEIAG